jgi:hypothetical protein
LSTPGKRLLNPQSAIDIGNRDRQSAIGKTLFKFSTGSSMSEIPPQEFLNPHKYPVAVGKAMA